MVYDKKIEPDNGLKLPLFSRCSVSQTNKRIGAQQTTTFSVILQRETKNPENRVAINEIFSNYAVGPNPY